MQVREAFKGWGVSAKSKLFLDFFGFFLKALGKHCTMGKYTSDAQPHWILLIDVLNDSQLHIECWEIPKTL